ncbi:MAG: response regulator [Planctomycetes bacterium]|nr:response regulator [Planctomycetota bacterium]
MERGAELEVRDASGESAGVYIVQGPLAKGGQGKIYALLGSEGQPAVVKVPGERGLLGSEIELRILQTLPPHPNVMKLLGTTRYANMTCAVLAWAHSNPFVRLNGKGIEGPGIKRFRGLAPKTPLPASTAVEMIQELLAALEHLHRYSFVHGDIKSGNVLAELDTHRITLEDDRYFDLVQRRAYRVILADFGSARSLSFIKAKSERERKFAPSEFTPVFAPPEVFREVPYHSGLAVDTYQVGTILYEWMTGWLPYDHRIPQVGKRGLSPELVELKRAEDKGRLRCYDPERLKKARHHDVVFAEAFASQRLRERFFEDIESLINAATQPDPDKRPTIPTLRSEVMRLFELQPPRRSPSKGRVQLAAWNPRWHLTRANRFSEASRVAKLGAAKRTRSNRTTENFETGQVQSAPESGIAQAGPITDGAGPPTDASGAPIWEAVSRKRHQDTKSVPRPAPKTAGAEALAIEDLRIALVDDDRVALAVLGRALRKRGAKVRTFRDPESALESLCRDQPDAAIIDMQMPGISGLELVQRLRRRMSGLPFPILILSSVEEEDALREAFRLGVMDYLVKPVTESELLVKVQKAIQRLSEQTEAIPWELGGFEFVGESRRSEIAVIFRAVDTWDRYDGGEMSLKVLRPDLAGDAEPLLRLRREVDVLECHQHTNLVRMREAGLEGRLLYYVADTIPAETLGGRIRDGGPLDRAGLKDVLQEVSGVLSYLHQDSIVVGDLSPESLGVTKRGRLLLCELGCARTMGGAIRGDEAALPQTRYSAPELFRDQPILGAPSDLYSLGVIALECWSGRPAVRNRSTGVIDVAGLCEGLPAHMSEVLAALVSPRPEHRPTARDLYTRLQGALT